MNSRWFLLALRRDVVMRGLRISGVVGTALVAVNQGDLILSGVMPAELAWKIPLTYLVPYLVSTYASVSAMLAAPEKNETDTTSDGV
jgi:hypothetical protein